MSTKNLVIILAGVAFIAFGIGFLTLNIGDNIFSMGNFSTNLNPTGPTVDIDESTLENIDGVEKINIIAPIAKVNIIQEDREDVSVHYHGYIPPNIRTNLQTNKVRNGLEIKIKNKNHNNINLNNNIKLYLDVLIPNTYEKDIKIDANLGDIKIQDLKLSKINVRADLGNINIENIEIDKLDVDCDLGNVIGNNIRGNANVEADLGNIELYYDYFDYDLSAVSNMGSIQITLPNNSNFNLDAKSDLGTIKTDFPVTTNNASNTKFKGTVGDGGNNINLTVDLGSIKINSK